MRDSDVVTYIVIRILLFSSAFQHASTQSCKDAIHCKISQLAHREMTGAIAALFAEMQRIESKHEIESKMANIPIGNIIYFDKEYFCSYIIEKDTYPLNKGCKSNLGFVSKTLLSADINKMKSVFVENKHYLILSGKSDYGKKYNQKPFWVLNINLEQMSRCCIEFARHISPYSCSTRVGGDLPV